MADLLLLLENLPDKPGVYLMKDKEGVILYIGKAVSLKNRVRQYFHANQESPKVRRMVSRIDSFEVITTQSEMEALTLESNLVKRYRPFYNILLKDDKHFPYARVDVHSPYPHIQIVRSVKDDGAKYFGPFLSATALRQSLEIMRRLFPIRECKKEIPAEGLRDRPCLNYQIGRCQAPCAGLVNPAEYAKTVKQVCDFLSGRHEHILGQLQAAMTKASEALEFEKAASLRDKIEDIRSLEGKQLSIAVNLKDRDVLSVVRFADRTAVQAFFVRQGKIVHMERFTMDQAQEDVPGDVLQSFMQQFYGQASFIPREILISHELPDQASIEEWMTLRRGARAYVLVPQRGEKRQLVEMATRNALEMLEREIKKEERDSIRSKENLASLQEALGLSAPPLRIEAYDISNIQGTDSVASMVVLEEGKPARKEYRRVKIKTVEGANDFASMAEVILRRFKRLMPDEEGKIAPGFAKKPDLVLIDGGPGQLSAALESMRSLGFNVPMIGLAKQFEEIFMPETSEPIRLARHSGALLMLQRIRDEAHRFAVAYHRTLRKKRGLLSELEEIPGVGKNRRRALLLHFGSVANIKKAAVEDIAKIESMTRASAEKVYAYFNPEEAKDE